MTLLTIITDVCARLALPQPTVVVGSPDPQVKQLLSLANEAGEELARDARWQIIDAEWTFVTTDAPGQAAPLPDDFERFVPNSFWNRSTRRPIKGPLTPQEWQALQIYPVSSVFLMYRERQGEFLLTPSPPAGQTIAFEYVSNAWAKAADGTLQTSFLADTDTTFLSEGLIKASLRWRFLRAKGLDYSEEMATFERNKQRAIGRDGGSSALSLSPRPGNRDRVNIPDGSFPGP